MTSPSALLASKSIRVLTVCKAWTRPALATLALMAGCSSEATNVSSELDGGAPEAGMDVEEVQEFPEGSYAHVGSFADVGDVAFGYRDSDGVPTPPFYSGPIDFFPHCSLGPLSFIPQRESLFGDDEVSVNTYDIIERLGGASINSTLGLDMHQSVSDFMQRISRTDGALVALAGPGADRGTIRLAQPEQLPSNMTEYSCQFDRYYVTRVTLGARFLFAVRFFFPGTWDDEALNEEPLAAEFARRRGTESPLEVLETQPLDEVYADLSELGGRVSVHILQVGGRTFKAPDFVSANCGPSTVKNLENCRDLVRSLRAYGDKFLTMLGDNPTPEDTGGWTVVRAEIAKPWWDMESTQ